MSSTIQYDERGYAVESVTPQNKNKSRHKNRGGGQPHKPNNSRGRTPMDQHVHEHHHQTTTPAGGTQAATRGERAKSLFKQGAISTVKVIGSVAAEGGRAAFLGAAVGIGICVGIGVGQKLTTKLGLPPLGVR